MSIYSCEVFQQKCTNCRITRSSRLRSAKRFRHVSYIQNHLAALDPPHLARACRWRDRGPLSACQVYVCEGAYLHRQASRPLRGGAARGLVVVERSTFRRADQAPALRGRLTLIDTHFFFLAIFVVLGFRPA